MPANLPEAFTSRMERELGAEAEAFFDSFSGEQYQGLRVNELKISKEDFLKLQKPETACTASDLSPETACTASDLSPDAALFTELSPVPWCSSGLYYPASLRPGRHVWHEAGFYYVQEPSAMSAAEMLQARPGERVLDLCAAPGGKSSQLAAAMKGEGLLVVNEIHPARAKILSRNMERMGVRNALVLNEAPDRLSRRFGAYFDRILCDAPCSGEGMFRKDPEAVKQWSPEHVQMCARRQFSILLEAEKMLKPGGRLVYSTCTFAQEENEGVIARFLEQCPWMEPDLSVEAPDFTPGKLPGTWRLWPHRLAGEGHGIAVLKKRGEPQAEEQIVEQGKRSAQKRKRADRLKEGLEETIPWEEQKQLKGFHQWETDNLVHPLRGNYLFFGEQLYLVPEGCPSLKGLKVLRPGLQTGEQKGKVFKPAHALAMALGKQDVKQSVERSREEIYRYFCGETLACGPEKGWVLLLVDGVSAGWGKADGRWIKNHYPKGLRVNWQRE